MTLNEKIAYIKGLAEGLSLDEKKPEVKVINEILELLEDMAISVTNTEELYDELSLQVDEIDEDLASVEEDFYCDDCDCDECDEDCCDFDEEDNPDYEVKCPDCGAEIVVDEDTLLEGEIPCPNCGNTLEFDFSILFNEDGCACGDPDCPGCSE